MSDLTQARLKELLHYDPETGVFTWRAESSYRARFSGQVAGSPHCRGYVAMKVDQRRYLAHRLAWLYVHGTWPEGDIDHDNRDRKDNRIANLRDTNQTHNNGNMPRPKHNTSGYKGVHWNKKNRNWVAHISKNKVFHHLGCFDDIVEAAKAYDDAAATLFGEFARTNFGERKAAE